MVLRISEENRWTHALARGHASLRKANDLYGSRDSSHHIAGGNLVRVVHVAVRAVLEELAREFQARDFQLAAALLPPELGVHDVEHAHPLAEVALRKSTPELRFG